MPLDAILDKGEVEKSCKAIGQEIFDRYKQEAGGSTEAGKVTAKKICEALREYAPDGKLRKQYIEHAWNGIGDSVWGWRA